MDQRNASSPSSLPRTPAERFSGAARRLFETEAASGLVLLAAAAIALIWANSPAAASYEAFWHLPLSIRLGSFEIGHSLHFWINDALMTVFFLAIGMELRRDLHDGTLSEMRQAILPLAAAVGGVMAPAAIYLALNLTPERGNGWAVPTATDIAFAVGMLALLGKSIPASLRLFLLALAVIDDVFAVLIIAFFYSGGLDPIGFAIVAAGVVMVLVLQRLGVGSALAYVPPGAVIWAGVLMSGAHPTLAGILLGLMTPVRPLVPRASAAHLVAGIGERLVRDLGDGAEAHKDSHGLMDQVRRLRLANRELVPAAERVQLALHPWVTFAIMPLFALANAGVNFSGVDLSALDAQRIGVGVALALLVGKPLGIVVVVWLTQAVGWGRLPRGVSWGGVWLIGLLGGIGFTMSIFIANLAFPDETLLAAAKLGVIAGSLGAAVLGLAWGALYVRGRREGSKR